MAYRRRKKSWFNFWGRGSRRTFGAFDGGGLGWDWSLNEETKKGILIILLFLLAALSLLGLFDLSGEFGRWVAKILAWIFGALAWIFPFLLALLGYFLLRPEKYQVKTINYIGLFLLALGLTGLWHLRFAPTESWAAAKQGWGGGYLGAALAKPLLGYMGFWGALSVSLSLFLVGLLLSFETSIYGLMWPVKFSGFVGSWLAKIFQSFKAAWDKSRAERPLKGENDYEEELAGSSSESEEEADDDEAEDKEEDRPVFTKAAIKDAKPEAENNPAISRPKKFGRKIELPLSLLTARSGKPSSGDIKANQEIIRKTLFNFGIKVEMGDVNVGPTVTQYTLRPAEGVKLSRIVNLNSDLALALAAHPIRIEAPIPGKSLVGVEIPNQMAAKVTMNDLLISKEFKERKNNLSLALGKDVSGKAAFAQLDRMPHLLIAGATGSGKSVCINSVIVSLLYQNSPDELKFILVDPKRVELQVYNGIPYLLTPVITDVKKTINALKWAVVEMENRFELLSKTHKRNIEAYNQTAKDKLPYIVFVIDELADLMASAAADVEGGIVRLAQMARAVGIHLILATQRPSVEVITGLIKANIPARVAFSVASLIDSRTILDASGAEKLVGRGDMLYLGPEVAKPKRLQGVYLSDQEIKNVIDYIKEQGSADYVEALAEKQSNFGGGGSFGDDDGDSLLGEAKEIIRQSGKASASLLQRRLKIGYARAARILDLLEDRGIIGPADGAKPREVFLDKLAGVGAVEFAAREHGLIGELRPDEEEEPTFTAFNKTVDNEEAAIEREETAEAEAALAVAEGETEFEEAEELEEIEEVETADLEAETAEEIDQSETETKEIAAAEEEDSEEEAVEKNEDEEEAAEETEEEEPDRKKTPTKRSKFFGDDEWT